MEYKTKRTNIKYKASESLFLIKQAFFNKMEYNSNEYKLAREIAETLNDMDSLSLHIKFVQTYSEQFLRERLNRVMSIPENKIRKTRGALYTSLVTRNGYQHRIRD